MMDRERYTRVAREIARYLAERQRPDGSFPGPDHYGVAFSLWLWSCFGGEFARQIERGWRRLESNPPRSHGEFNAYALLNGADRMGGRGAPLLPRLPFGRRHSANWMLLRAVCRSLGRSRLPVERGAVEARVALLRYARAGFIADRPGVRSFAYHAFCGALLADLWRMRGWRWAGRAAARAAHSIAPFILPDGDALYLGRGQQQIFGYGALIYLLEAAAQLTGRQEFQAHAARVTNYLLSFQRPDGSFPLVLRHQEPAEPWAAEALPGWYSYNRYADYLPLLGCFLLKAAAPAMPLLGEVGPPSAHADFRVHTGPRYWAVLARPGEASTNDLAFPYICVDGVSLFPCYGAEGEVPPEAVPLPYGALSNGRPYVFRRQLRYRLTECGLVGASPLVHHRRHFSWGCDGFTCKDEIVFRRGCRFSQLAPANFLFRNLRALPGGQVETCHQGARARLSLTPPGRIYHDAAASASGPLVALRHCRGPLSPGAGERLSVELEVRFL